MNPAEYDKTHMYNFVFNIVALVGLLGGAITFGAMGDNAHAGEALSVFVKALMEPD